MLIQLGKVRKVQGLDQDLIAGTPIYRNVNSPPLRGIHHSSTYYSYNSNTRVEM